MAARGRISEYTECTINNYSEALKLDSVIVWEGSDSTDFPRHVLKGGERRFRHDVDQCGGSVGGLKYDIGGENKCKLVFAWSHKKDGDDKAYTEIFPEDDYVDWVKIKNSLNNSGQRSSAEKCQISSAITIGRSSSNDACATATVTLNKLQS